MEKIKTDLQNLKAELRDQVTFLLLSVDAYDKGTKEEVKRISLALRILFFDSLLMKLNILPKLYLYDTSDEYKTDNAFPYYGLVIIRFDNVLPCLDQGPGTPRNFTTWKTWSKTIILDDAKGNSYSRGDLIKTMADKRGAHVDINLPAVYVKLSDPKLSGLHNTDEKLIFTYDTRADYTPDDSDRLLPDPVAPSIRQLAHEVLVSLALFDPDYFSDQKIANSYTKGRRKPPFGLKGGGSYLNRHSELAKDRLTQYLGREIASMDGETLG